MSDEEREEKEFDLTTPEVVTKYKNAAEILNSYYLFLSFFVGKCLKVFFFLIMLSLIAFCITLF